MVDAGWYKDPELPTQLRWWDGQSWTDHRHALVAAPQPTLAGAVAPTPYGAAPVQQAPFQAAPYQAGPVQQLPVQQAAAQQAPVALPPQAQWSAPPQQSPYPQASVQYAPAPQAPAPVSAPDPAANYVPFSPSAAAEYARPVRRRGPRPLLLIVGAIVIVGALFIVFVLPKLTPSPSATTPTAAATTAPGKIADFGTPGPPDGLTALPVPSTTIVTAGSALATGTTVFANTQLSNPQCVALSYALPVTGSDKGSADKILILPSYSSGGSNPAVTVSGAVRDYASPAAAQAGLSAMETTFNNCLAGYTNHAGKVLVSGESIPSGTYEREVWTENEVPAPAGAQIQTENFINGRSVLRVTCVVTRKSSAEVACSGWTGELQSEFNRSN